MLDTTEVENGAGAQRMWIRGDTDEPVAPRLLLSSEGAGWEGLAVQAYHEPSEMEGWIDPGVPGISLVLVTRGAMHVEGRPPNGPWKGLTMREGDLSLMPGVGAPYELRWKSLSSGPLQTLHLRLDKDLISRTAEEVAGHHPARMAVVERVGFQDPLLTQIGLALGRELEQGSPAGKLYAQTAAQMLAVHLLRHYTSAGGDLREIKQELTRHQVKRVTDFVQAHLSQDLSLETLARQIGFSAYHFARLFRQTTGESPHQFVLRQRLERAQRLLNEQEVPLTQVALESGFAHQSHLTQVFKRHLGLTPRAYRRDRAIGAGF